MPEVIGAAPGHHSDIDWHEVWGTSENFRAVHKELDDMRDQLTKKVDIVNGSARLEEFAMPLSSQLWYCFKRVGEQYWRTPSYIHSKATLCIFTGLFTGFSFYKAGNSLQGLQNQTFSLFMLLTIFGNFVNQIMPLFVGQRSLYEVRERPSKAYSWKAFLDAQILIELPWQTLMSFFTYAAWYYPIGMYRNGDATHAITERSILMFLFVWAFFLFTSTFAHMVIAAVELAEVAGQYASLIFTLSLIFCGVIANPATLPRFWIFMYRVSPFTYLVSGMLSTGLANTVVTCSSSELATFDPPSGQTYGNYLANYIASAGGAVYNPDATLGCQFCSTTSTNTFLKSVSIDFSDRWRNFGLIWVYIVFNVVACILIYWLARVPRGKKREKKP